MSTEQQERLLAGGPFADGGELDEIAGFMRALRAYGREEPHKALATALVPRLGETARMSEPDTEVRRTSHARARMRRPLSRRALVARVAFAVAVIPASTTALAFAGVDVPQPARDAFEGVGVELPNQPSDNEGAEGLPTVPSEAEGDDTEATENGRGKGNAPGKPAKNVPKEKALGHAKAPGQGGTPPGKAFGQDKAKSNQGGGSGKAKKTPPGKVNKPPKPPLPPQSKGKR